MTIKQYLFEGAAAGTATTAANTGANLVNKGGGTQTFTAGAAAHGSCGIEIATTASGQYNIARFLANAAAAKMAASFVFSYTGGGTGGANTADMALAKIRQSSSDVAVIFYRVSAADKFYVTDSGSTAISSAGLQVQLVPGTQYRVETVLDQGASTVTVELWSTAPTPTLLGTWSSTGANLTAFTPNGIELGNVSSNVAITLRFDDLQLNDGATSRIGAYNPASNPLTGSGSLTPTSGTYPLAVTVTLTASGGSGTGRQFSVDWGDGTTSGPQSSGGFSHTYAAAGNYSPSGLVTEP